MSARRPNALRGHKHAAANLLSDSLTAGDILYVDSNGDLALLPIGTDNQVLAVDGTNINWETLAAGSLPAGTTDGSTLKYSTGSGTWIEDTDITMQAAATGSNNTELHFTGNQSTASTVGLIHINSGNSGDNWINAHDGTGQGFNLGASFSLSSVNHAAFIESYGTGAALNQPLMEWEQDGWVHMHNRNVRFNTIGSMNLEENAAGNSMTGITTMGQFWVKNDNPNNPKYTNGDGSTFDITKSDGTTGGSGSAGAGNQYIEIEVGTTTYKVLHDGTV